MSAPVFRIDESGRKIWVSGSVIIEGVEHRLAIGEVVCDPSLNRKAWNTTEAKTVCRECFKEYVQVELFA